MALIPLPKSTTNLSSKLMASSPKVEQQRLRRGIVEDQRVGLGGADEKLLDLLEIGAVGDPKRDLDPSFGIRQGPVHQFCGDELLVGDDHFAAIPQGDGRGPDLDSRDLAHEIADGDDIADPDRAARPGG